MWIFANSGFVSIVEKPKGSFMARARDKKHLETLFPGQKIIETRQADYRFRCIIDQEQLTDFMIEQSKAVTYDNFKNSIRDNAYHDACSKVWGVMYGYQEH